MKRIWLSLALELTLASPAPAQVFTSVAWGVNRSAPTAAAVCILQNGICLIQIGVANLSTGAWSLLSSVGYGGVTSGAWGATGNLGEVLNCTGTAVSQPTSGTPINVCTLALTAGNWLCRGNIKTIPASTTTQSRFAGALNSTSITIPAAPAAALAYVDSTLAVAANIPMGYPIGEALVPLSGAASYYLVGNAYFATSTMTLTGYAECLRVH
jgi:hypothetical protein